MINITVMYMDGTTHTFLGESFQQGDKALTIKNEGRFLNIPAQIIRVYEVSKHETKETKAQEPDGETPEGEDVPLEGDTEQEEILAEEEEAS